MLRSAQYSLEMGWLLCSQIVGKIWMGCETENDTVGWWSSREAPSKGQSMPWIKRNNQCALITFSLLELLMSTVPWGLCFSLPVNSSNVISFLQLADEILESAGGRHLSRTSSFHRDFTLRAFEGHETPEVKNGHVCKACRRYGHCLSFGVRLLVCIPWAVPPFWKGAHFITNELEQLFNSLLCPLC